MYKNILLLGIVISTTLMSMEQGIQSNKQEINPQQQIHVTSAALQAVMMTNARNKDWNKFYGCEPHGWVYDYQKTWFHGNWIHAYNMYTGQKISRREQTDECIKPKSTHEFITYNLKKNVFYIEDVSTVSDEKDSGVIRQIIMPNRPDELDPNKFNLESFVFKNQYVLFPYARFKASQSLIWDTHTNKVVTVSGNIFEPSNNNYHVKAWILLSENDKQLFCAEIYDFTQSNDGTMPYHFSAVMPQELNLNKGKFSKNKKFELVFEHVRNSLGNIMAFLIKDWDDKSGKDVRLIVLDLKERTIRYDTFSVQPLDIYNDLQVYSFFHTCSFGDFFLSWIQQDKKVALEIRNKAGVVDVVQLTQNHIGYTLNAHEIQSYKPHFLYSDDKGVYVILLTDQTKNGQLQYILINVEPYLMLSVLKSSQLNTQEQAVLSKLIKVCSSYSLIPFSEHESEIAHSMIKRACCDEKQYARMRTFFKEKISIQEMVNTYEKNHTLYNN